MDADRRAILDELEAAGVEWMAAKAIAKAKRDHLAELVREAHSRGVPVLEIAYVAGTNRQQVYGWVKQ